MINPKDVAAEGFRSVSPAGPENAEMRVQWTVPADLPYFQGHFPGNPTLPGVAMIDLSLELVRRWPGFATAELTVMKAAKFTAVVGPGDAIEVLLVQSAGGEWRAEWSKTGGEAAASLRFLTGVTD
jgi:3-hydroxymyristoyl/3-hydroxydecanoyl-(acyl carrier protein) dehydratase